MSGKFDRYWELTEGGPYEPGEEMFKCSDCGAETFPEDGWNGEPEPGLCKRGCKSHDTDWAPGNNSRAFKKNFDRIFPGAPGSEFGL